MKLPLDAEVDYQPDILTATESERLYESIFTACDFSNMTMVAAGKTYTLNFGKCMLVDPALMNFDLLPEAHGARQPWIDEVLPLKAKVESVAGMEYNVGVCIYYKNGESGVDFHADLPSFGDTSSIASVSLGQEREFVFRRIGQPDETYSLNLSNGSLLLMGENCQDRYEHSLLVDSKIKDPRINLTFRSFGL